MTENQAAEGRYFRALRGLRQIRKGKVLFMEGHGFIRDMLDVKLLILFVASKAAYPMSLQKIYELCFQDDRLSYFDLSVAVPQMVDSGHLAEIEKDRFVITQKGREAEAVTEDGIAYPVMQRAKAAVERFNKEEKIDQFINTEIVPKDGGDYSVVLELNDETGSIMRLELMAPTQQQARALAKAFRTRADQIYQGILSGLLEKKQPENDANV